MDMPLPGLFLAWQSFKLLNGSRSVFSLGMETREEGNLYASRNERVAW